MKLAINNPYLTADAKLDDYLFNLRYALLRNVEYHFADFAAVRRDRSLRSRQPAVASKLTRRMAHPAWRKARAGWRSSRSTARFAGRTSATRCPRSRGCSWPPRSA